MDLRQSIEQLLSALRSTQTNAAAVRRVRRPLEQTLLHASIHQLNNRVVLQAERFCSIGNRRRVVRRNTRHRQQKLMLLRMETSLVRSILADQLEFP